MFHIERSVQHFYFYFFQKLSQDAQAKRQKEIRWELEICQHIAFSTLETLYK